jgi:hypothetical protein
MNTKITNVLNETENKLVDYVAKKGIFIPDNLDIKNLSLWKSFFCIMAVAHSKNLITDQSLFEFIRRFSSIQDFSTKEEYYYAVRDKLNQSVEEYEQTISILAQLSTEQKIENYKKTLAPEYAPLIDYIVYSYLTGVEIDEKLIDQALYELSPEGQEVEAKAKIYQAVQESRRNPLNAGKLGGNFNKAFSNADVVQMLSEGDSEQSLNSGVSDDEIEKAKELLMAANDEPRTAVSTFPRRKAVTTPINNPPQPQQNNPNFNNFQNQTNSNPPQQFQRFNNQTGQVRQPFVSQQPIPQNSNNTFNLQNQRSANPNPQQQFQNPQNSLPAQQPQRRPATPMVRRGVIPRVNGNNNNLNVSDLNKNSLNRVQGLDSLLNNNNNNNK